MITSKSEINMFPYDTVKQKHKIITSNKEIVIVYKDATIDDKITICPDTNLKGFSLMISLSAIDYKDYNYDNDNNVVTMEAFKKANDSYKAFGIKCPVTIPL